MGYAINAIFRSFLSTFYENVNLLLTFVEWDFSVSVWFWLSLILQITFTIGIVCYARKKGLSGSVAFILCLAVPALGALVIIDLLPGDNTGANMYPPKNTSKKKGLSTGSIGSITGYTETKKCRRCGEIVSADVFKCPKCNSEGFD